MYFKISYFFSHEALMSAGCASACPGPSDGNQGARNADSSPDSFWVPSRLQRRSSDDLPSPGNINK